MFPPAIHECISTLYPASAAVYQLYPARTAEEEVTEKALNTSLH